MSKYKEMKVSTASEEEDYYILQPMFQKLPPNEIISQKYAPDVIPQIKLITLKNQRRNNAHFVPPKTKNLQLQNYAYNFHTFDYLGNQYVQKINQVVYLKFNNSKYNVVPQVKHKTRVMPAFYVPFQQLYSPFQTTFTKNIGLNFPETHNNAHFPVAKANRGCCFDPIFCSSYQSANLFAAIRKNPFQYDLILQNDVNSCREVNWFNFSVQFLQQGYYSFRIKNMTIDMSKLFQKGMKISYSQLNVFPIRPQRKVGDGWSFCGQNIMFSQGVIENEMRPGKRYYQLYFQFRVKNKHDIFMFALECPYTTIEAQKFFSKAMFKKARGMTKIQRIEYGRTISGSPLSAYLIMKRKVRGESIQMKGQISESMNQIKDRKSLNINLSPLSKFMVSSDIRNRSVIIIGRLGASDVNTSFLMQGMIEYLLDNLDYDLLKRSINFYFVPVANSDGVKYGNSVTNLTGSDLVNDWKQANRIYEGEIYYLKELFMQIERQNPISLVVSLATERSEVTSSILGFRNENDQCEDSRIFPYVLSKRNKTVIFQNSQFFNRNENESICCVLGEILPKAMIYQLNISHFQCSKRQEEDVDRSQCQVNDLRQCTPDSYRNFGRQFLSIYLEHVKLYDRNILLRDKWIREINQIQFKIGSKENKRCAQRPIQERFSDKFYTISNLRENHINSEVKTCNSIQSCSTKLKNDENTKPLHQLRKQKISDRRLPQMFNEMMSKRKMDNVLKEVSNQMMFNQKKQQTDQSDQSMDKPYSLFKITDKKVSILKNCVPNTLNFQNGIDSRDLSKKIKKQRTPIEKQILKKQLSTKLLKKVKIEDHLRFRSNKEKSQKIINNS